MSLSVIKYDIFACRRGIAEAVSDIKAERFAVYNSVSGAPIPCVIICPYASAPVESAKIRCRVKFIVSAVKWRSVGSRVAQKGSPLMARVPIV